VSCLSFILGIVSKSLLNGTKESFRVVWVGVVAVILLFLFIKLGERWKEEIEAKYSMISESKGNHKVINRIGLKREKKTCGDILGYLVRVNRIW
jgi:hypothetical protein